MRIIHITDPHLSSLDFVRFRELRGKRLLGYQSWYRRRRHQYRFDTLQRVTAAIHTETADLVIVSGDLVQIGLESELREARAWLESLGGPETVLVAPGNHDCYHPESWPLMLRQYESYLGTIEGSDTASAYPILRRANGISIITASSAVPSPWWAAFGTLGPAQRQRLRDMLQHERKHLRIFVLHHPPLPGMASPRKALTDAAELQMILQQTTPQLILHGHLHRNQVMTTPYGRIFCTAPPSSVRERAPASYRIFEVAEQRNGWQIDMTLKSLIRGELEILEQTRWIATCPVGDEDRSVDSGKSKEARAQ